MGERAGTGLHAGVSAAHRAIPVSSCSVACRDGVVRGFSAPVQSLCWAGLSEETAISMQRGSGRLQDRLR